MSPFCISRQASGETACVLHAPSLPDPITRSLADQLVSNMIHDVRIVEAAPLVRPPALDIDAGLVLQVGQVEIVPRVGCRRRLRDIEGRSPGR